MALPVFSREAYADCSGAGVGSDAWSDGVNEDIVSAKLLFDQAGNILSVLGNISVQDTDRKSIIYMCSDSLCHIVDDRG